MHKDQVSEWQQSKIIPSSRQSLILISPLFIFILILHLLSKYLAEEYVGWDTKLLHKPRSREMAQYIPNYGMLLELRKIDTHR